MYGYPLVIIADDDHEQLKSLKAALENDQFDVRIAFDGEQALKLCKRYQPQFLVANTHLSELNGFELCKIIKDDPQFGQLKVLLITHTPSEAEESMAFDLGASAYLAKPIRPMAFLKRLYSLIKRKPEKTVESVVFDDGRLVLEPNKTSIRLLGNEVHLPAKTFELLMFLASNPERVYSRDELMQNLWSRDEEINARTVDVHIRKIREKTGEKYILTIKGVGYKFISYN